MNTFESKADKEVVEQISKDVGELKSTAVKREDLQSEVPKLKEAIMNDVVERYVPDGATMDDKIRRLRDDMAEEDMRRTNLIIFNMEENQMSTPNERKEEDTQFVYQLLS